MDLEMSMKMGEDSLGSNGFETRTPATEAAADTGTNGETSNPERPDEEER
jgi:hypothetical protein